MANDLVFLDTHIPPGETVTVRVPVARLPTGTLIDLPVHVLRGPEDGPTLLLQAAVHGDEINGIEVLRRLKHEGLAMPGCGTVLMVPVLNVFGFVNQARDMPDGKDINRSFPGSKRGSLASRVAWHHTHEVLPHADVAIDLHTGGGRRHNHPQVRYTTSIPESKVLADAFAAPFRIPAKMVSKSFRHAAAKRKIPVIIYEGGQSMYIDEHSVEVGMAGIRRVMHHLGMIEGAPAAAWSIQLTGTTWVRARRAGLFRCLVSSGDHVTRGQPVAQITDPFETFLIDVKAPKQGYVITVNQQPVVNQGDVLLRLGTP
jgi:predicted deacylase